MPHLELIVPTDFGLEGIAADELRRLGYADLVVENGKITFPGTEADICKANIWLRTGARVRLKVGEFKAVTFEELFEKTKALPWADFFYPKMLNSR